MKPEEFEKVYPFIVDWIRVTLVEHSAHIKPVATAGFKRLSQYFTAELLASAKFVPVDVIPAPPLSAMGLTQFEEFEKGEFNATTYFDTFFIKKHQVSNETIFFHELIHVVQWKLLGPEKFIMLYAGGLEKFGYRESPLEVMAYDAAEVFSKNKEPFDAEKLVAEKLRHLK